MQALTHRLLNDLSYQSALLQFVWMAQSRVATEMYTIPKKKGSRTQIGADTAQSGDRLETQNMRPPASIPTSASVTCLQNVQYAAEIHHIVHKGGSWRGLKWVAGSTHKSRIQDSKLPLVFYQQCVMFIISVNHVSSFFFVLLFKWKFGGKCSEVGTWCMFFPKTVGAPFSQTNVWAILLACVAPAHLSVIIPIKALAFKRMSSSGKKESVGPGFDPFVLIFYRHHLVHAAQSSSVDTSLSSTSSLNCVLISKGLIRLQLRWLSPDNLTSNRQFY